MRHILKFAATAAVTATALAAFGSGAAAFADTTSGDFSLLGGNQLNLPISAPINISGNSLAAFGTAKSASTGGATVRNTGGHGYGQTTRGNFSAGGGNQLNAPISVPVNLCGNAGAVFGVAAAACKGGAHVVNHHTRSGMHTSGNFSLLGGNQANTPVSVPINICGNTAAVFGVSKAACKGGATVHNGGKSDESSDAARSSMTKTSAPAGLDRLATPVSGLTDTLSRGVSSDGPGSTDTTGATSLTQPLGQGGLLSNALPSMTQVPNSPITTGTPQLNQPLGQTGLTAPLSNVLTGTSLLPNNPVTNGTSGVSQPLGQSNIFGQ